MKINKLKQIFSNWIITGEEKILEENINGIKVSTFEIETLDSYKKKKIKKRYEQNEKQIQQS